MSRPRETPLKLHYRHKRGRREYRVAYYDEGLSLIHISEPTRPY